MSVAARWSQACADAMNLAAHPVDTYRAAALLLRGCPQLAAWVAGWASREFTAKVVTGHALSAIPATQLDKITAGLAAQRADAVLTTALTETFGTDYAKQVEHPVMIAGVDPPAVVRDADLDHRVGIAVRPPGRGAGQKRRSSHAADHRRRRRRRFNPDPAGAAADGVDRRCNGIPAGEARVTLYSKPGCHLCEDAREVIARVCTDLGTSYDEVDITTSPELLDAYWEQIPVTFVDGRQHDFWRVDAERLRTALTQTG